MSEKGRPKKTEKIVTLESNEKVSFEPVIKIK